MSPPPDPVQDRAALLLSAIVDSSDDAIISKDLNGIITSWNPSAQRLFGYTETEALGKHITMLIPEDRGQEEVEIISRIRAGERVDHFETVRKRKDGSLLDISLTISPIKDHQGKIVGASKIARDITERKRIDREIRRANKDLEQFAFSASHDLQEPLRNIKIYSELLNRRYREQLEGDGLIFLEYLHQGAKRMETLVQDLLAYSRASKVEASSELHDANGALAEALEALRSGIAASGATITWDPLPSVYMHQSHLRQLFQNLIGNSIKYCPADRPPVVHIAARTAHNVCTFAVQDNGLGIAEEYQTLVFELFKRLHTSTEYPGSGMGLAICERIIERYQGRIWVESRVGAGSTFYFTVKSPAPVA